MAKEDVITTLIQALTKHQNGNSAVPDLYRNGSLPLPQRPGLLTRLFDRTGALQDEYAKKQLEVILETGLAALQTEAKGYLDTVEISVKSKVRVHEHRILQQEAVLKKQAEGEAQIDLHVMQQRLLQQVAELGLDPEEEVFVIAKIVATCMSKSKDNTKENHHGSK